MMKYNGGMAAFVAVIPPHLAPFHIFDPLILTRADSNSPIYLISKVIPLLLDSIITTAIFETVKHTPVTHCMGKSLGERFANQIKDTYDAQVEIVRLSELHKFVVLPCC